VLVNGWLQLCYVHKSSTGTVRRLLYQISYDSTAPKRRMAGVKNNRTIKRKRLRHRTVPGEIKVLPYGAQPASADVII